MNPYEQGYIDQLRGTIDGAKTADGTKDAAAYRAGARTCRGDLEAERDKAENHPAQHFPAFPDWARRLTEFRAKIQLNAPEGEGTTAYEIAAKITAARDEALREAVAPVTGPITSRISAAIAELRATPNAFAEPEPGVKKPRKPKPTDDSQTSFL